MYLAINKKDPKEFHNFKWTFDDRLIIKDEEVNPSEWDIVEVEIVVWHGRD